MPPDMSLLTNAELSYREIGHKEVFKSEILQGCLALSGGNTVFAWKFKA